MGHRGACFELHAGHAALSANPASNHDVDHHPNPNPDADPDPDLNPSPDLDPNRDVNPNANPDANSLAEGGLHP